MTDFSINLNVIIAILGIVVSALIAYFANWRRNKKSLSYIILTDSLLLTTGKETGRKLELLYKGETVSNGRLVNIRIVNDGKQPIVKSDFDKTTLDFIFADTAEILSAEIISVYPENLQVSVSFERNRILLGATLLNGGDFIDVKVIVNTPNLNLRPDGRIVGISKIRRVKEPSQTKILNLLRHTIACIFAIACFSLVGFVSKWLFPVEPLSTWIQWIESIGIITILIFLFIEYLIEIVVRKKIDED